MEYVLKNGRPLILRTPETADAERVISVIATADTETLFLGRNPGEFHPTVEKERDIIQGMLENPDGMWLVAEYDGKLVGQCSAELVRRSQRYRHRAQVAFVVLKEYWGLGIGGRMIEECLRWCRQKNVSQAELDVVTANERALALYKSFGFEIVGVLPNALRYPDGSGADEYRMVKLLEERET